LVETVPWPPDRKRIDIGSIYVSHDRLTAATGWEPTVDLADGLRETIGFYREHGDHYWTEPAELPPAGQSAKERGHGGSGERNPLRDVGPAARIASRTRSTG